MYLPIDQLQGSIRNLNRVNPFFGTAFLAFKKAEIPIGETTRLVFSRLAGDIMNKYYRPSASYPGFYNPFLTSDPENRWNAPRYPSTSLQRITTDTFGDALLHPKKSQLWGWRPGYASILAGHLGGRLVPAFDLAVWLFREEAFSPGATRLSIVDYFFKMFRIDRVEADALFEKEKRALRTVDLIEQPITERELLSVIGHPPGSVPEEGGALRKMRFRAVGPADEFCYEPSQRLNIITGDNSLGKTFLLDSIWWALAGEWLDEPAMPRSNVSKETPRLTFSISANGSRAEEFSSSYDWDRQEWTSPVLRRATPGLVIYSRYDGSYAVWDPVLSIDSSRSKKAHLFLKRRDIWYGLPAADDLRAWACNGILRDWITWQTSGSRYEDRWSAFVASLKGLSPYGEPLVPGQPIKLPFNEMEIPTLTMPYGKVAVIHASAGVKRTIALAYILVWAWFRHVEHSSWVRRPPQRRLVLMVDEVEAHLHPRWQRVIVPALMDVVKQLAPSVTPQIHIATHSPMVMASIETIFVQDLDNLHHLKLVDNEVRLEELEFVKRGRVDLWLMSQVFGLEHARSLPAERAIEDAKALQLSDSVPKPRVLEVHQRLLDFLAEDDDFWPRWRYFARERGVDV